MHIELRFAGRNVGRMRSLARELSDLRPDVIVVSSSAATKAVQEQTRDIPIVLCKRAIRSQAASSQHRASRRRVTDLFPGIGGKWLELFNIPRWTRVALIFNPDLLTGSVLALMEAIDAAVARSPRLRLPRDGRSWRSHELRWKRSRVSSPYVSRILKGEKPCLHGKLVAN